jgi:hypothetical protein
MPRLSADRSWPDRRRVQIVASLSLALAFILWMLWLLSFELPAGPLGLTKLRIRYGLFGWYVIDTGAIVRPGSRPWPWSAGWQGAKSPLALIATVAASLAAVAGALWGARIALRRLQPRTRCGNCGQWLRGGFRDSPVCPECGELPHRRR